MTSAEGQHKSAEVDETATTRTTTSSGPVSLAPDERPEFTSAVERGGGAVIDLGPETRGLIWTSYSRADELADVLVSHSDIAWVQLPWAGVDRFASTIDRFGDRVLFTSAKGAFAQPVAEHALALTLALMRFLPRRARLTTWDDEMLGESLFRRNVTIIGAGGITRELIRLLNPFNVRVTVVRRRAVPLVGAQETVSPDRLARALSTADVVILAAAHTSETTHLLNSEMLAALPRGAVLVNVARGPLIDTDALVASLQADHLAGVGLDVTDPEPLPDGHPLWTMPNVLITPHQADTPEMTAPLLAERIEVNVRSFLAGAPLTGVVDPAAGY